MSYKKIFVLSEILYRKLLPSFHFPISPSQSNFLILFIVLKNVIFLLLYRKNDKSTIASFKMKICTSYRAVFLKVCWVPFRQDLGGGRLVVPSTLQGVSSSLQCPCSNFKLPKGGIFCGNKPRLHYTQFTGTARLKWVPVPNNRAQIKLARVPILAVLCQ